MQALLLSAGLGTRLMPYTEILPKPLMPIHKRPLIEYWLNTLNNKFITKVFINVFYKKELIIEFIESVRDDYYYEIEIIEESELCGTAGTIAQNIKTFTSDMLVLHVDNFGLFDISEFCKYARTFSSDMVFMAFKTDYPESCGIFTLDKNKKILSFEEKPLYPKSNIANAAIYYISKKVIEYIQKHKLKDFSNEVIPFFAKGSPVFEVKDIFFDIGNFNQLKKANNLIVKHTPHKKNRWIESRYLKTIEPIINDF